MYADKYLKYKSKYNTLKKILKGGAEVEVFKLEPVVDRYYVTAIITRIAGTYPNLTYYSKSNPIYVGKYTRTEKNTGFGEKLYRTDYFMKNDKPIRVDYDLKKDNTGFIEVPKPGTIDEKISNRSKDESFLKQAELTLKLEKESAEDKPSSKFLTKEDERRFNIEEDQSRAPTNYWTTPSAAPAASAASAPSAAPAASAAQQATQQAIQQAIQSKADYQAEKEYNFQEAIKKAHTRSQTYTDPKQAA